MANISTYYAGQTVAASMQFEHKRGVRSVRATFVLSTDSDVKFELSGRPRERILRDGNNAQSEVLLTGDVNADDTYGVYTCKALEAEYPGGRTVQFESPVSIRFEIAEEYISPPRGVDDSWEWLSEDEAKYKDH